MRAGSFLALIGLAIMTGCAVQREMVVTIGGMGTADAPCFADVAGERIPLDEFLVFARRWRGREAHLNADIHTPYRCFGRVLYELQRAGFGKIGFISEPAPAPETAR
jgi:hypothetical protein